MMTTGFYSFVVGVALAVLTVVACLIILLGWFLWLETKLRRSQATDERPAQGLAVISPGALGGPDLAPPSTSAAAQAEIAELEKLWHLPVRHRQHHAD